MFFSSSSGLCTRVFCLQFHFPFVFFSLAFPLSELVYQHECFVGFLLCTVLQFVQQIFRCLWNAAQKNGTKKHGLFFSVNQIVLYKFRMKCEKQKRKLELYSLTTFPKCITFTLENNKNAVFIWWPHGVVFFILATFNCCV